MSTPETYDIAVLGGGPGGYATALRGVARGLRVVIVEADKVGGTCLHRGCIPSKALLHVAHLADQVPRLTELGLATAGSGLDVQAAGKFRDTIVGQLHRGLEGLLRSQKIDVVKGWGRIEAPGTITVDGGEGVAPQTVHARHIVIATGSTPVDLPGVVPDGKNVLRSDDALQLGSVPASAVIVGAGAIGIEFASLWRSLGVEVTVVEAANRILPLEDPDSSAAVARAFKRRGIDVRTSTSLKHAVVSATGVTVEFASGAALSCEQLLIAVGRRPATAGCGLDELGVLDKRGFVVTAPDGSTAVAGIWAVGDAVPTLALAHAAFAEGFVVADAIAGLSPTPVDHSLIPRVTYSTPEVASVGLTEPEAREKFGQVNTTTSSFAGNAKALIDDAGSGHVKLVHTDDGTLVGAHVVGPAATELIAELSLATAWQALVGELGDVVHAHPSLAENVRETALAAAGIPFHAH
ncbi:MAG: Dihydrolipoamide dehydrogenase of branched-chain alpha-keto acid dehydrogenase [Ilumatobacteraceae bacterium]|nr:Dihydrolipoamide dehydrogenase of branched-chain alpha-keto acid dehydrogenase [Ilumatobacteraceae bacterium]